MTQPAYRPPPRAPRRPPSESAGYIPWWLLAIVAALFVLSALAAVAVVIFTRPADLPRATATAVMITAAPSGVDAPATATPQSLPTTAPADATDTVPPPPPGDVAVGSFVQVTGTGDAGVLNLRSEPSLQHAVNFHAIEREVLQVQAGPTEADGFTWWYLVDPATNTRFGWAVQNYLETVQGP